MSRASGTGPGRWTLAELADLTAARTSGISPEEGSRRVARIVTDTRNGIVPGDLFVALRGPNFRGDRFAAAAIAEGACAAIVADDAELPDALPLLRVADPLVALQQLASESRTSFSGTVVGITGSHGKTTVKEMLGRILSRRLRTWIAPMSWNSQVGVARALLEADPGAEVWLIECGISLPGEMERLARMVRPHLGVLVSVGDAHLAGLGDREGVAREKVRLFLEGCERVVIPAGSAAGIAGDLLREVGVEVSEVSVDDGPEAEGSVDAELAGTPSSARVLDALGEGLGSVPFLRADAAVAVRAAELLGVGNEEIQQGLAAWAPAEMRMEMLTTPRGVLVINDAYTSDPTSLAGALRVLSRERTAGRSIAVLGGLADQGHGLAEGLRRVGEALLTWAPDMLLAVGEGGAQIAEAGIVAGFQADRVSRCDSRRDAADLLDQLCRSGDRVLVKGARPERLEKLVALLFESLSPARLIVDLSRVRENYRRVKELVGPDVEVLAVLKAFGYGLDAVRLARTLEEIGADCFGVAYPDEGVLLRERGVTTPILVQNVSGEEMGKVIRHGLTAQVSSVRQMRLLADEARRHASRVRVHLKVDTGMGRSGAWPSQMAELADALTDEALVLDGLMTHLAASEDPASDASTREQFRAFEDVRSALRERGLVPRRVHAANSSGIARFPEGRFNMVRLGLGLFGCADPETNRLLGVEAVMRFETRVLSVRDVPAGSTVGYGRTWTASRASRIAVVGVGYADGVPWSLGNRGWMTVRGQRAPIAGRVCMDVTMLDVTDIPDVDDGDTVTVYGWSAEEPSVPLVAETAGTIPYELLTRISPRVRRIFLAER